MASELSVIGKNIPKLDGIKLATGRPAYTDDFNLPGMLYAKILRSPYAHAKIINIDVEKAKKLTGVKAVLTYKDLPRIPFTTAGQGYPEPSPYDTFILDYKVRYVGDRVAAVAAENLEIAQEALKLIEVEYKILPAVLDPRDAQKNEAPIIHDEEEAQGIYDCKKNLAAFIEAEIGNVKKGFEQADLIVENEYFVPYTQHSFLEPHISITYFDENKRLVVRTSTQVPFHLRRILARILKLPLNKIRVIKPRIGGGFGGKQELVTEDLCACLTLATRMPVRLSYTRSEEFIGGRTRHSQIIKMKTGVKKDGRMISQEMKILANTGAYGSHALTVQCNTGNKTLALYRCPNIRYEAQVVYTNLPIAGAFRGYGAPQGYFAMESQMDEIASLLGMDPIEFRKINLVREGDHSQIAEVLGEGKEGYKQIFKSCGINECIKIGKELIRWEEKRKIKPDGIIKRGIGIACFMQGSGIPGVDMGGASLKMNEDGSFNLMAGAADLGTGSDTILAQIAAEVLGTRPEYFIVYSSDTDFTPFDSGAYASSTTYISGMAVKKAAEIIKEQIINIGAKILGENPLKLKCFQNKVVSTSGKSISFEEIALAAFYQKDQFQIMSNASHVSNYSPAPFGAQFAEVEVNIQTGFVKVLNFISVIDSGKIINPYLAEGQVEGAVAMGIGYALWEEMLFNKDGVMLNPNLLSYKIPSILDLPELKTVFVETYEESGPFGAKSVAELPINGPAPAIANAIYNAIGIRIKNLPITSEKIWNALKEKK